MNLLLRHNYCLIIALVKISLFYPKNYNSACKEDVLTYKCAFTLFSQDNKVAKYHRRNIALECHVLILKNASLG